MNKFFSGIRRNSLLLPAAFAILIVGKSAAQNPGINLAHIDTSNNPCQDFYHFCNGGWQKNFKLPESDARYGSFNEINENNLKKIKVIYEKAARNKSAAANTDAQRLRDFYNTAMDSAKADKLGFSPLAEQMAMIESVKTPEDFIALKSKFEFIGVNLLFAGGVSTDLKSSQKHRFSISQAGYGLGDRDYYHDPEHLRIKKQYENYLKDLFILSGVSPSLAGDHANMVVGFETRLTEHALTRVQMRDVEMMYNIFTPSSLKGIAPAINWEKYFQEKNVNVPDSVNVAMVQYLQNMSNIFSRMPVRALQVYAQAQLLMEAAPFLTSRAEHVHFAFRGQIMSGTQVMKSRWQRVHNVVNGSIGEIVSKDFVKEHFPPASKEKVNKLIDNLILAYRERIQTRDWMTAETKKQANRKLDLLIRKVGYPEKWKNYSGMAVDTTSYWSNVCKVSTWLVQDNLNDLKKPVDRSKWQMTPITVNAYYDPTTNEITFPAAILQPPFFDPKAEDAANYGTMGAIIGHELTHGFDDQGSRFDAEGNMKMWWTPKDYENFKEKTARIVKQFDEYVAIDSLRINGSMTQGENIADLGGLTMAYYAYKKSLGNKKSEVIGGFTGEQRFFIAWAQGWKSITRPEELRRLLTIDYHSPAQFRAYAPLTNMNEFYEAFGVKAGDKMYRPEAERVEIW